MRHATLDDWLDWQLGFHPRAIDPGLDRVGAVAERLGILEPGGPRVITVAGTNGKGSSVALLDAVLQAAGYRTGAYTSPHLLRYNERIRLDGNPACDAAIMAAFDAIDRARGDISLSYFEFGTLAALLTFRQASVDVMLLEVGLGGRLDAVNVVDPDLALITSIGLDHTEWLGPDRESVGREKAGILRAQRPAVFAGPEMPRSIGEQARRLGASLQVAGCDYTWRDAGDGTWTWTGPAGSHRGLPLPTLPGDVQTANAAGAIAALECLTAILPVPGDALRRGLRNCTLPGRLQRLPGAVEWVVDVAHNPDAIAVLARLMRADPARGRHHAVFALMGRKDLAAVAEGLAGVFDHWWPLDLPDPEARPAGEVATTLRARGEAVAAPRTAEGLLAALAEEARPGDRVVVFGSFRTAEAMLRARGAGPAEAL